MNDKLLESITKLVETGGTTALWLYGIYILGTVLKFTIAFGCGLAGICKFCNTWKGVTNAR